MSTPAPRPTPEPGSVPAAAAPDLWARIRAERLGVVAVMGMTKNTGKTVALNHLLARAAAEQVDTGLSSIGRDGEDRDAVFWIPKPPVIVWPGSIVATARDTLLRAQARTRLLGGTGITGPLGEIVLLQVQSRGTLEVAGASRGADQRLVIECLRQCGADTVLLDGALGRSLHASPAIADGVVLATGAALGGGLADVLRKTAERLALLTVPAADAGTQARCAPLFAQGGVGLWQRDGRLAWQAPIASLDAAATLMARAEADLGTVAVTGAVGRRLWAAFLVLAERHPGLQIVVGDGTRLFVEAADRAALAARGAALRAWRPIRVVGITTNPFSPMGGHLEAAQLLAAARRAFPAHAVTDVVLEAAGAQAASPTPATAGRARPEPTAADGAPVPGAIGAGSTPTPTFDET